MCLFIIILQQNVSCIPFMLEEKVYFYDERWTMNWGVWAWGKKLLCSPVVRQLYEQTVAGVGVDL